MERLQSPQGNEVPTPDDVECGSLKTPYQTVPITEGSLFQSGECIDASSSDNSDGKAITTTTLSMEEILASSSHPLSLPGGELGIRHTAREIGELVSHGVSLFNQFALSGAVEEINQSIECLRFAVVLTPEADVDRPGNIGKLGCAYLARFERLGELPDLEKSIKCGVEAVSFAPNNHKDKIKILSNLGAAYGTRFESLGEQTDLEKAIDCGEEANLLTSNDHALKSSILNNVACSYQARFNYLGELSNLDKAIEYGEAAISLVPAGEAVHPSTLNSLGASYQTRFDRLGKLTDLNKAIECGLEAVLLTPDGHLAKPGRLSNLGISYESRFKRLEELLDLQKSIQCAEAAAELTPEGHPDKSSRLTRLGNSYIIRFSHVGEFSDLSKAIKCAEEAISLTPEGHRFRARMLNNLGCAYLLYFEHVGELSALNKAIEFGTEAVSLIPDGQTFKESMLHSLAGSYRARFISLGNLLDLDKVIECEEGAVSLTSDGNAAKANMLYQVGETYRIRFSCSENRSDIESAIECYRVAAQSLAGPPDVRFDACRQWAHLAPLHTAYPPYPAYQQAMELLPQLIWIGTTIDRRYDLIADLGTFATEAAAYAISINNLELALEWLEAGRSIVWGQITQLRTPFDLLATHNLELASKLRDVGQRLECAGSRSSSVPCLEVGEKDSTKEANDHVQLALDWNKLLDEVRSIYGFEDFLRPPKSSQLLRAVKSHPIAVINAHESRCDALIIQPNNDVLSHIPLPEFSVRSAITARQYLTTLTRLRKPFHLSNSGSLKRSRNNLWLGIVQPILDFLGYTHKLPTDQLPHITWCTTGLLSCLPLHAAECYDQSQSSAFDFVISSYTPTLSALPPNQASDYAADFGILAVSQEDTPGYGSLPGTIHELAAIRRNVQTAHYMQLERENATIDRVLDAMEHFSWVHLACHGSQDTTDPTQSAFHLHDGSLTLATISKRSFRNKGLAFLSACQTATGDENLPDEAVHLAAGMLMAGYPSVIGTMWSIADEDGPRVADKVYASLLKDGKVDHTKAAKALHEAVTELRAMEDMPFERWAPFIHIGS